MINIIEYLPSFDFVDNYLSFGYVYDVRGLTISASCRVQHLFCWLRIAEDATKMTMMKRFLSFTCFLNMLVVPLPLSKQLLISLYYSASGSSKWSCLDPRAG